MTITAAEAYKRTVVSANYRSDYGEDHRDIMLDIEDACDDGEYGCEIAAEDFDDIEKHMDELKANGFDVELNGGTYFVSWKNAAGL